MLTRETADLILFWHTNSSESWPQLVDYLIWVKLQERVYRSWIYDVCVGQLNSRLIEDCSGDLSIRRSATNQSGSDVHVVSYNSNTWMIF